jgi:hypothetical protein
MSSEFIYTARKENKTLSLCLNFYPSVPKYNYVITNFLSENGGNVTQ